ncbi:MAG: hypothetical protein JO356_06625, partial [Acidobacteria bacterium]|nr:hypothetical protein [Acidobacteriota bacterium]
MNRPGVLACLVIAMVCRAPSAGQPIRYVISLEDPERHLIGVEMEIPPGGPIYHLQLPVWNALYQIRDFAQYLSSIGAQDFLRQP